MWNKRDWQNLNDRKFYFQKFTYRLSGHERRIAYRFMKDFPVKRMVSLLSEHYKIEIDTTEFDKFITKPVDGDLDLSVTGVITNEYFTWNSETKHANTIEFSYANQYEDESTDFFRKYRLQLKTEGKERAYYEGIIKNMEDVITDIKTKMVGK